MEIDIETVDKYKEYWEKAIPFAYTEENLSYDRKRQMRYELQDYMHKVIPFTEYKRCNVLELGFGSGIDALEFARNGALVTAFDFTDNAVKIAEENKKECAVRNSVNCNFFKANLNTIHLPKETYHLVYSFGVLHHIINVENIIKKAYESLRYDGKMIVMLYNRDSLLHAYSIEHLGLSTERITGCPYTWAYWDYEAELLFKNCGFKNVEVKDYYNVIDLPEKRKVRFYIPDSSIKKSLGWHLIIKASK